MFALIVRVKVKPEHIERYKEAILADALGSVRDEPGCLRFDVSVDNVDPTVLYFYEIYKDEAALEAHRQAPHFLKYREATQGLAEESVAQRATTLFPPEGDWAKPTITDR
jgi:(4S)-4-hydroxy-5-phosphonooxypentane-2,3-dione isomerase